MAFRDDRDAQLHRADALERENERLRQRLAEREAADASAAELEQENASLRDQLVRARGPGLARRILARIAALRLPEPRTDGGYAAAALTGWRLYLPVVVALAIPAVVAGGASAWALAGFAVGAPALALLFSLVPWALNRRRRANAGLATGAAIGIATSVGFCFPLVAGFAHFKAGLVAVGVGTVLLFVTRGAPVRGFPYMVLPFVVTILFPHPGHLLVWFGFAMLGASLADPGFE